MDVNHVVETPQGDLKFQGTLSGQELAFVVEVGLNYLMKEGAIPFVSKEDRESSSILLNDDNDYEQ